MKILKSILTALSFFLFYALTPAQGNCQGDNIRVFKGANGCGCQCMKECVTPEELPVYRVHDILQHWAVIVFALATPWPPKGGTAPRIGVSTSPL